MDGLKAEPEMVKSRLMQESATSSVFFPLHVNDAFGTVHNGAPFLFADNNRLAHAFQPEAPESNVNIIS